MSQTQKKDTPEWVEDSVVFRGVIRRSGNSLAITIPAELLQRFLLKEGQEFVMLGMSRLRPDFEGALQVYLGYFVVYEKTFGISITLSVEDKLNEVLKSFEYLVAKYGATKYTKRIREDGKLEFRATFGMIADGIFKRIRSKEDVESIMADILAELLSIGAKVESSSIFEEILEWRNIDPAMISKLPHKAAEMIRWKWEI
ncbi:MAG: AbrB/MazE/SpoVT family DNA-binding domain-containing protein [Nitrososphaerota archaeon]|nr:AbrB/MazE/SpoVT family DNA-binding domain-containing protein [Aigarchaeota archaeon]MDW8076228.1 AbrB/MazE/SpoVT family DNA-binding domain-containing protein [Nitrososphaerota archaeon]